MKTGKTMICLFCLILIWQLGTLYSQINVYPKQMHPMGAIRNLQHVNNGPFGWKGEFDLSADYRELKISSIRTHDYFWFGDINHFYKDSLDGTMDPNIPRPMIFIFQTLC